ncbi:MAG TPA: zf-HC2 domain-containing protein [Gemmatimonadaceae bacterium]|nr:zf-HC2 domain-containing protein [Gemmatimonadaceae bacterium]
MISKVSCDEFGDRLADLLERDLDETTRAALESHALSCGDCGPLLADVRKLRIDASSLPVLAPRRDLWDGIAARIDAPVIPLRSRDVAPSKRAARWPRWASMAAAAVLLIALTSTSTYYLTIHTGPKPQDVAATESKPNLDSMQAPNSVPEQSAPAVSAVPGTESSSSSAVPVVNVTNRKKQSAEQVYSAEIARLHTIVERRRTQLDPVTISVIERNLKVIDDAIAQCRLALAKDPGSRFLMESLNNALENKVELLRTATTLPARS